MSAAEIDLMVRYRPLAEESIAARHTGFVDKMNRIGPPLGFEGIKLPPIPDPKNEYSVGYKVVYSIRGLRFDGNYKNRRRSDLTEDEASYDDHITIRFKTSNKALNYAQILHGHFPKVIEAYGGYLARDWFDDYSIRYEGNNSLYKQIKQEDSSRLDLLLSKVKTALDVWVDPTRSDEKSPSA